VQRKEKKMPERIIKNTQTDVIERTATWVALGRAGLIAGGSGGGKSEMVHGAIGELLAQRHHPELERVRVAIDCRLSYRDSVDFRGIPCADMETGTTKWLTPDEFPRGDDPKIFFFDEIGQGLPPTQNAVMQLVLDGKLGEYVVPLNTYIIAATNRECDGSFIRKMSSALRQRFALIELSPSAKDWRAWAIANGIDRRLILATGLFPELIEQWDGSLPGQQCNARELTSLHGIINSKYVKTDAATMLAYASDVIGEDAAIKVAPFIADYDGQVKPSDVFKDPNGCDLPRSDRFDNTISLTIQLCRKATMKNTDAVLTYVDRLNVEYRAILASGFTSLNKEAKGDGYLSPQWGKWIADNQDLLS
jgi:hypothetical protein